MKSIRRHLTIRLLATTLTLAAAAGLFLYAYARWRLVTEFDRALIAKAAAIEAQVLNDGGQLEFNFPAVDPNSRAVHHPDLFEIRGSDGGVLTHSPALRPGVLPQIKASGSPAVMNVRLPGDRPGRAVAVRFVPQSDADDRQPGRASRTTAAPVLTLVLARDREELDEALRVLWGSLLVAAVVLSAGIVLAVTLTVRRGLRPLQQLGVEADAIGAESLHHRFSLNRMPRELQPIGRRLNGLVERLAGAFERERRFNADVAHELRTPIAELRSLAEVALKWPDGAADAEQNYRDTLEIAGHMEALVTSLLAIARCQAGAECVRAEPLELSNVLKAAWRQQESVATSRGLSMDWQVPPATFVQADRPMLLSLFCNLFSNAATYAPKGSVVECTAKPSGTGLEVTISNPSDGLRRDDLPHLSEPFWRKDAARSGGIHCGLGLSLVAAYAGVLGTAVRADLEEDNLFCVSVTFPAAQIAGEPNLVRDPAVPVG